MHILVALFKMTIIVLLDHEKRPSTARPWKTTDSNLISTINVCILLISHCFTIIMCHTINKKSKVVRPLLSAMIRRHFNAPRMVEWIQKKWFLMECFFREYKKNCADTLDFGLKHKQTRHCSNCTFLYRSIAFHAKYHEYS